MSIVQLGEYLRTENWIYDIGVLWEVCDRGKVICWVILCEIFLKTITSSVNQEDIPEEEEYDICEEKAELIVWPLIDWPADLLTIPWTTLANIT